MVMQNWSSTYPPPRHTITLNYNDSAQVRQTFAEIGERRGYYPAHGGREDALLYAKPLV